MKYLRKKIEKVLKLILSACYFPGRNRIIKYFFRNDKVQVGLGVVMDHIENIQLENNVLVNNRCKFLGAGNVKIHENTYVATDVKFLTTTHLLQDMHEVHGDIEVEKFCWIGSSAVILPGVVVREGAVIGAGAVVTKSTTPYSVWAGNPAREIKKRKIVRPYRLPGGEALQ